MKSMMNRKMGVENPSTATIVCQGETFTFKLDQALADNGGIFLIVKQFSLNLCTAFWIGDRAESVLQNG